MFASFLHIYGIVVSTGMLKAFPRFTLFSLLSLLTLAYRRRAHDRDGPSNQEGHMEPRSPEEARQSHSHDHPLHGGG